MKIIKYYLNLKEILNLDSYFLKIEDVKLIIIRFLVQIKNTIWIKFVKFE